MVRQYNGSYIAPVVDKIPLLVNGLSFSFTELEYLLQYANSFQVPFPLVVNHVINKAPLHSFPYALGLKIPKGS